MGSAAKNPQIWSIVGVSPISPFGPWPPHLEHGFQLWWWGGGGCAGASACGSGASSLCGEPDVWPPLNGRERG
jgi:hypothetical protein